jgi:hypothetical protein
MRGRCVGSKLQRGNSHLPYQGWEMRQRLVRVPPNPPPFFSLSIPQLRHILLPFGPRTPPYLIVLLTRFTRPCRSSSTSSPCPLLGCFLSYSKSSHPSESVLWFTHAQDLPFHPNDQFSDHVGARQWCCLDGHGYQP